jgi:DNA-binding PadR family transcriptional regulator
MADEELQTLTYQQQLKLIQQVLQEVEREGLVKRTGEYRNGRPVYSLTECGTA